MWWVTHDIWLSLCSRPGRTALIVGAVALGTAALTALFVVMAGFQQKTQSIVSELGANVFVIAQPNVANPAQDLPLGESDLEILRANLSGCTLAGARRYCFYFGNDEAVIVGTDGSLPKVRPWHLLQGRFIDEYDLRIRDRVAVVTKSLSEKLQWHMGDVIIAGTLFLRVVGIVEDNQDFWDTKGAVAGTVFIPRTVDTGWASPDTYRSLDAIYVQVNPGLNYGRTMATAARLLDQEGKKVAWITPDTLLQGVKKWQSLVQGALGIIAGLCLLLAGATLMSLMLSDIRERVAEIGLRRSLGALAGNIAGGLLAEALVVVAAGGLVGVGLALGVLASLGNWSPLPLPFTVWSIWGPLLVVLLMGGIFAYWPARLAARITIAEALRNE